MATQESGQLYDFEEWQERVDDEILEASGQYRKDLPDCTFADWYNRGVSFLHAAHKAIRYAQTH